MTATGSVLAGLPAGLRLRVRPFRDASDYEAMATLESLANVHDGIPWLPTAEAIKAEYDGADGLDPRADIAVVENADGLVAVAVTERTVRDRVPNYDLWGYVHPDHRRLGIGSALFEHNLARIAVRVPAEDPVGAVLLRAHAEEGQTGHEILLETHGFNPIRQFLLMRRAGFEGIPDAPLPAGLELRPVAADQHRRIWEAECEAFQDHWGAHTFTEHDFDVTFGRSALDTSLWTVAWDGDEVAGVAQGWIWREENATLGIERGWLEKISVRRPWRQRGLGRALTAAGLARLRDAGMSEAMLGVDAQNPTGALGLYERLGFEVEQRMIAYQRSFDRAPTSTP